MCGWVRPATPSMPFGRSMPCQWMLVCSGSLLVTKMRTRSPSTASIVGPGRLAVVAPQMRLHAGRELAHDRLGDEVELLPTSFMRQGSVQPFERDDRLVVQARWSGTSGGCIVAGRLVGASGMRRPARAR